MPDLLYNFILCIHAYRFPLTVCLLILSIILALIPIKQNVRKIFVIVTICFMILMVFMVLRVELRSPFSKPTVNEQQVEILIQSFEKDSEQVVNKIKESGTKRAYGLNEGFSFNSQVGFYMAILYDKEEYFEDYDLLKEDNNFNYFEYSDKYDFREELKLNGYFEQENGKGIRVICYPVIYRVASKWSSIYLPFEPDGSYQERIVIMFDESVIEFIGESELKCTLDLGKKIQVIIEQLD